MPIEEISPMKLAAELGVRPQQIYGLVRKGRINSWIGKNGKTVIGREEATNVLSSPQKRGPKTDKTTMHDVEGVRSPVKVGDVVSWRTRDGVRVAQVTKKDPPFNWMKDWRGEQVFFRNHTLAKRLSDGVAHVERPRELLNMIAWQFRESGDSELATRLEAWVASNTERISHVEVSRRTAGAVGGADGGGAEVGEDSGAGPGGVRDELVGSVASSE